MAINNNLLIWTKDLLKGFTYYGNASTVSTEVDATVGGNTVLTASNSAADGMVWVSDKPQRIPVNPGETYTVSSDFKANHTGEIYFVIKCLNELEQEIVTLGAYGTRSITFETWYNISGTFTVPDGIKYIYTTYRYHNTTATYPSKLSIYHPKLELGNVATAYRPAGIESPNLIRNSRFYKGLDFWNGGSADFTKVIDDDGSMKLTKVNNVNGIHASTYTTKTLDLNQTYTITMELKNNGQTVLTNLNTLLITDSVGSGFAGGVGGFVATLPADNIYHTYTWTFTVPASGNVGAKLTSSSTSYQVGQSIDIRSIKLEQGIYQTEWTAAPEDIAIGIDREIIASAQKTIFDYYDTIGLVTKINSNLNTTQQYRSETGIFTPDWTTTNVVLTASLYKNEDTTDIINTANIQGIKWYRVSAIDGVNPVEIVNNTTYTVAGKTLTVKQNTLNDKSSIDFICEIVYRDPITSKDILTKKNITFSRVNDGAIITKAKVYLPNGNGLTNGEAQSYETDANKARKNLILGSNVAKSTTTYNIAPLYTLTENWAEGETWTVTIKGTINAGQVFGVWRDSGNQLFKYLTYNPTLDLWIGTGVVPATVNPSKNTMSVYNVPSATATNATIQWIKLEKGSISSNRWTMPPEEYPLINPGTTPDKWIFNSCDSGGVVSSTIPTYDKIKLALPIEGKLITDTVNLVQGYGSNYYARLRTGIYSDRKQTFNMTYGADDASNVYVNGESIRSLSGWAASIPTTMTFNEGWNTVDFLWNQGTGGDGLYGIKVGNTNLQALSGNFIDVGNWVTNGGIPTLDTFTKYNGQNTVKVVGNNGVQYKTWITLKPDTYYTYSMMAKSEIGIAGNNTSPLHMWVSDTQTANHLEMIASSDSSLPAGQWKLIHIKFKTPNVATTYYMKPFLYNIGSAIVNIAYSKIEEGTSISPWSQAPEDDVSINPNTFSKVFKLDASNAQDYVNRITNITAKAELTRASLVDTTNVTYQWYKQDSTILTSQGGGVGWLKLISTSSETGYNTDTLIIPSSAINIFEVYKCVIKDTQVDSLTYNTVFEGIVSVTNSMLPIEVRIEADGSILLNGQGQKSIKARLFQGGKEIDTEGNIYTYNWYRWLSTGVKDTAWNNSVGYKTGKTLVITSSDVDEKATFSVEVL